MYLSYLPLPIEDRFDKSQVFCLVFFFLITHTSFGLLAGFMQHLNFLSRTASRLKSRGGQAWLGIPEAYLRVVRKTTLVICKVAAIRILIPFRLLRVIKQ